MDEILGGRRLDVEWIAGLDKLESWSWWVGGIDYVWNREG